MDRARSCYDPAALARFVGDDPVAIAEALALFREVGAGWLESFAEARRGGDAQRIGELAHRMKSSAAMIGAEALRAACAELEARARAHPAAGLVADCDRAAAALAEVIAALAAAADAR